jgi:hypothetical protein
MPEYAFGLVGPYLTFELSYHGPFTVYTEPGEILRIQLCPWDHLKTYVYMLANSRLNTCPPLPLTFCTPLSLAPGRCGPSASLCSKELRYPTS